MYYAYLCTYTGETTQPALDTFVFWSEADRDNWVAAQSIGSSGEQWRESAAHLDGRIIYGPLQIVTPAGSMTVTDGQIPLI